MNCPQPLILQTRSGMKKKSLVSHKSCYDRNNSQKFNHLRGQYMKNEETHHCHQSLSLENSVVETSDMKKTHCPLKSYHHTEQPSDGYESRTRNWVYCDKLKCPAPLFTKDQKKLAIEAWKIIDRHVKQVK